MAKGVNIVIGDKPHRVLVLKRSPDVEFSPDLWDLPGGRVEEDEHLREAAQREVKEESGLDVELEDNYFYIYHYTNDNIDIYAFQAHFLSGDVSIDKKHTQFRWISKDDWQTLLYTPSVEATLREFFKQ